MTTGEGVLLRMTGGERGGMTMGEGSMCVSQQVSTVATPTLD